MTAFSDATATKGDLRELEARLESQTKTGLRELEARLESQTKTSLRELEARLDSQTKADLRELEVRLESKTKANLRDSEARLESHFRDMFATKADLFQMETRITRWVVGAVMGSIGAATAIAFALARFVS